MTRDEAMRWVPDYEDAWLRRGPHRRRAAVHCGGPLPAHPVCVAAARTRGDPRLRVDDARMVRSPPWCSQSQSRGETSRSTCGSVAENWRNRSTATWGKCASPTTALWSTLEECAYWREILPFRAPSVSISGATTALAQLGLPVKCRLPRRLDERGVLDDLEVLAGGLVLAQMVGGDGNLQHLKSGLDRLGSGDVLLVILRRVQLCGDGRGQ
jgi:hypothetical protein